MSEFSLWREGREERERNIKGGCEASNVRENCGVTLGFSFYPFAISFSFSSQILSIFFTWISVSS